MFLHRVRLPRYAHAGLRQAGRQGVGTGTGHLRTTAKTPFGVHSFQVSRAVRGYGDGTVLQSFPLLRPECRELHQLRPDRVGRWQPYIVWVCQDTNGWIDPLGLDVFALFEINGKIFEGVNPTQRIPRIESPIPELQHLGYTNSNTFSMHAEIDAMKQAKDLGLRGGKATLMVEGLDICPSCRPAIMDYAKSMGISELEIHELNSGKIYRFEGEEINQVKNGGKSWRAAEVSH